MKRTNGKYDGIQMESHIRPERVVLGFIKQQWPKKKTLLSARKWFWGVFSPGFREKF